MKVEKRSEECGQQRVCVLELCASSVVGLVWSNRRCVAANCFHVFITNKQKKNVVGELIVS